MAEARPSGRSRRLGERHGRPAARRQGHGGRRDAAEDHAGRALPIDPDGDIGIRSGSAMVFVRVRDNPPLVDVFSPILTEVEPTERLYMKLSELTNRMPIGRLYCTNDTVWASVPGVRPRLPGHPPDARRAGDDRSRRRAGRPAARRVRRQAVLRRGRQAGRRSAERVATAPACTSDPAVAGQLGQLGQGVQVVGGGPGPRGSRGRCRRPATGGSVRPGCVDTPAGLIDVAGQRQRQRAGGPGRG